MILLALILAQAQPWVPTGSWLMHGAVTQSCGVWLETKDDAAHRLGQTAWASGFLSGINLAGDGKATDVDPASLVAYVDQQCAAKPLEKVAGVVFEFFLDSRANPR